MLAFTPLQEGKNELEKKINIARGKSQKKKIIREKNKTHLHCRE
jgi:hypothetical protein